MKVSKILVGVLTVMYLMVSSAPTSFAKKDTDQLIIQFQPNITQSERVAILGEYGLLLKKNIPGIDLTVAKIKPGKNLTDAFTGLKNSTQVKQVEIDDLVSPEGKPTRTPRVTPNDPLYKNQWHLPKIQADYAWAKAKGTNVIIGVCDTGVQADHPDLVNSLYTYHGYNTADNTTNWSPVHPHGTMVAGAMAASTNNRIGVAGVAWGGKIAPVRITNAPEGWAYVSDAAECITYLADRGVRAANLSYRMAEYDAISAAAEYGLTKNLVTVVAGGNDGLDPGWPDFPSFLAVSATTNADQLASFSSFGTYIDLAAPGSSILTTSVGSGYSYASGTSLAAPLVTGAVGVVYSAKPSLTPSQVMNILVNSADDLGSVGEDIYFGKGRLNLNRAVDQALATP